jgi:hypothetical protein
VTLYIWLAGKVAEGQLPGMLEHLEAGRGVPFGPIEATTEGFGPVDGPKLPWNRFHSADYIADYDRMPPRAGRGVAKVWIRAEGDPERAELYDQRLAPEMPNLFALEALAERLSPRSG